MIEQPLKVTPIYEIHMGRMEPIYVRRVYHYLETALGCKVEPEPGGGHHIIFPDGTVEEIYAGQSTQWTYRTTIRFPTGQTLTKYESVNIRDQRTVTTMLAFPNVILDGPEPPQK